MRGGSVVYKVLPYCLIILSACVIAFVLVAALIGQTVATPSVHSAFAYSASDRLKNPPFNPKTISWISRPPPDSTNAALLSAAKALMRGIYTYSPGEPDYLPSSYTGRNNLLTDYVLHGARPSNVTWAADGGTQVVWSSVPHGRPKGWSAIVVDAGPMDLKGQPEPPRVLTDCSGLITALFAYANTEHTARFTGWTSGSTVPDAGCHDPYGNCTKPTPVNYYRYIVTGENGWFRKVSLSDLQPGDMISYARTDDKSDTGHIMLVVAVSAGGSDPLSRYVIVIDETKSPHSHDTRKVRIHSSDLKKAPGIGMGVIRLSVSPKGKLQFFWSLRSAAPEEGAIALGRAL